MAAREMAAAQKALRKTDYDSSSEDDDEEVIDLFSDFSSSSANNVRQQQRGEDHSLSSSAFDPYSPTFDNNTTGSSSSGAFFAGDQTSSRDSPSRDMSLLDDSSVHTVETAASIDQQGRQQHHPTMTSSVPGGAGYLEMEEEPPRKSYNLEHEHESITTSSGLMLTHRRPSPMARKSAPGTSTVQQQYEYSSSSCATTGSTTSSTMSRVIQSNGMNTIFDKSDPHTRNSSSNAAAAAATGFRKVQRDYFEVEHGYFGYRSSVAGGGDDDSLHGNKSRRHSMPMLQARRFLSFVRIWMVISAAFLLLATGVLFHSFSHHHSSEVAETVTIKDGKTSTSSTSGSGTGQAAAIAGTHQYNSAGDVTSQQLNGGANQIILVPVENISDLSHRQQFAAQQQQQQQQQQIMQQQQQFKFPPSQIGYHTHHYQPKNTQQQQQNGHGVRRALYELRQEFEDWVVHHKKQYHSVDEKESRFQIWVDNHHRTIEKNERHGPCKLTKQAVFGSTHFKDLSPEEFKAQYLTGYNPVKQDELDAKHRKMNPKMRKLGRQMGKTLKPGIHHSKMHESIKQRMLQEHGDRILKQQQQNSNYGMRNAYCKWYDVACMLRWLWNEAGIQFGSIVGTMEPKYDSNAFPNAIDWRDYGVVTSVRSQGNCGACWAITAVETVESAHAIATGNLYDLSEAEIITCDDSCDMCSGGWPQNAFDYVMEHGGLPLYNSFGYDADTLLSMTYGIEGSSSSWTEDSVKEYRQQVCPAEGGGGDSHDSGDSSSYWENGGENGNYGDYSDQGRYGNIKGYGYATDRCICYSDGSGCDCANQDEALAVANVASHGPAVVCLDAALWQDYSGGIMTSDIGCGSEFLDVNHCVQVVGYAFTDGSNGEDQDEGDEDEHHSGSGSRDSSSGKREGYWIVRNQWGYWSWGMSGYAYVAMGENTCGILNDMTQAYL